LKGRKHFRDLSIDRGNIKMYLKKQCEDADHVYQAQDRVYKWAVVNTVVNLLLP
jgi:hypothetical protein